MQQSLKVVFENDYISYDDFISRVLTPIFGEGCVEDYAPKSIMSPNDAQIKDVRRICKIKTGTIRPLTLYDITLSDRCLIQRARVSIQRLIRSEMRHFSHALMLFHYADPQDKAWRFSYVYKEGTIKDSTTAKRFTYVFGKGEPSRTAAERFALLKQTKKTDEDLKNAFSVEALSKEFYARLFKWYEWAISDEAGITFPIVPTIKDKDGNIIIKDEAKEVKIIRLITRLLFVWFIKQKHLVPHDLFDPVQLKKILKDFDGENKHKGNYYNAILQNLFFATLNKHISDESGQARRFATRGDKIEARNLYRYAELFKINEREVLRLFERVPFLNGGLFDCLDKFKKFDGRDYDLREDGFSRNMIKVKGVYKYVACIPDRLFFSENESQPGLLNLLAQYNFTIEENANTDDVEVSLDPELLGQVFENLLASYNPETKENARKSTGSFYTPREIVSYMVDESLVAYLHEKTKIEVNTLRALLRYDSDTDTERQLTLNAKQKTELVNALHTCKILDPACGSGAFPMGILQKMVHLLNRIDPTNDQLEQEEIKKQIKRVADKEHKNVEDFRDKVIALFAKTHSKALLNQQKVVYSDDYPRKLLLIENAIYGVDIQPIAIQITKLRFFISLVCEQEDADFNSKSTNYNIKALPNLETKFIAANTLLPAPCTQDDKQNPLKIYGEDEKKLRELQEKLVSVRKQHFYESNTHTKQTLRAKDEKLREQIEKLIINSAQTPNKEHIEIFQQQIKTAQQQLSKYQKKEIVEEYKTQDTLFEKGQPTLFAYDKNKEKRDQLTKQIKECKDNIQYENNKTLLPQQHKKHLHQLFTWNPYDQNKVAEFFEPEWMFNIKNCFDIVIGNPPYIQLQNENGKLARLYESENYQTFTRMGDIYCLFYERACQLLVQGGYTCFITSNKWMRAGYGEALRKFLVEKTHPVQLIDFSGVKIFATATVDTNILLYAKKKSAKEKSAKEKSDTPFYTEACVVKDKALKELSVYYQQHHTKCQFAADSWVILSPIEQSIKEKIERVGTPLKDWDINIYRGILTGYNAAFIIGGDKRKEILAQCKDEKERKKTDELIRPILRGRDIKRYGYNFSDLWLINTHNGIKEKGVKPINIKEYPAVKKHLDNFYPHLEKRQDKGDTFYNLRNCAYMDEFFRQKIVYIEIMTDNFEEGYEFPCFSLDEENKITLNTGYIMTGSINDLEYILGVLNSKLGRLLVKYYVTQLQTRQFRMLSQYVIKFPIPKLTKAKQNPLINLVRKHIEQPSQKTENEINQLVYKLYQLNKDETAFIDVQ